MTRLVSEKIHFHCVFLPQAKSRRSALLNFALFVFQTWFFSDSQDPEYQEKTSEFCCVFVARVTLRLFRQRAIRRKPAAQFTSAPLYLGRLSNERPLFFCFCPPPVK